MKKPLDMNAESVPFPKVLRIEPASRCNFKCIHCPTGLGLNESLGIMDEKIFDQIIEKIKDYRFRIIVLYHGGEPFLNKNFVQMVKRLRPFTEKMKTVTNGSLLNDSLIEQILESEIDMIEFSLDGTSPEENDKIRVGSNFARISENIKKLIITRNNRNLVKPQVFISNAQIPKDLEQINRKAAAPQFLQDAFKDVHDHLTYKVTYSLIWPGMPIKGRTVKPESNFCDHIINTFTIRWNGDVVPCCYDLVNMMVMGNVLNEDLESIWNNEKYQQLRNDIANFNPPDLCKDCLVLSRKNVMLQEDLAKRYA